MIKFDILNIVTSIFPVLRHFSIKNLKIIILPIYIIIIYSVKFNLILLFQKAFGWDGGQTGGSSAGPQSGGVGSQGAQGLVHWMSVMAEHMDPAMSHYMSWNQEVSFHYTDLENY